MWRCEAGYSELEVVEVLEIFIPHWGMTPQVLRRQIFGMIPWLVRLQTWHTLPNTQFVHSLWTCGAWSLCGLMGQSATLADGLSLGWVGGGGGGGGGLKR